MLGEWELQTKFIKGPLLLTLMGRKNSTVYLNSFTERGLNEGQSFLSLRFWQEFKFKESPLWQVLMMANQIYLYLNELFIKQTKDNR